MNAKACPFCGVVDDHTEDCYFTLKAAGAMIGELQAAWNRRATPVSGEPFAWMKPKEIEGLLKAASQDGETRHYGRIYARQYDPDMVPVRGPLASPVDSGNV